MGSNRRKGIATMSITLWVLLAALAPSVLTQDIVGCGSWGCDQGRSFQLGGIPPLSKNTSVRWVAAPGTALRVQCVAVTTYAVCSCSYRTNSSTTQGHGSKSEIQPLRATDERLDIVSYTAADGQQFFASNQLPSAMVYPLVSDTVILVLGTDAMSGLAIDGSPVGQIIPVNLHGVYPPSITANGVFMFVFPRGEIAGYLTNGIPHASMYVKGKPVSAGAVGGPDMNTIFFISQLQNSHISGKDALAGGFNSRELTLDSCIVYAIGVYRRMDQRFGMEWNTSIPCPVPVRSMERTASDNHTSANSLVPVAVPAYAGVVVLPSVCSNRHGGVRMLNASTGATVWCVPVFGSVVTLSTGQSGLWVVVRNTTSATGSARATIERHSDTILLIDMHLGTIARSINLDQLFQPPLQQNGIHDDPGNPHSVQVLSPITLGQTSYTNGSDIAVFAIGTFDEHADPCVKIVSIRDTLRDILWETSLRPHRENYISPLTRGTSFPVVSQIVLIDSDPSNPRLVVSVGASVYGIG
eukprot:m.951106 g.951106  ORF g.951106 m.951106 type:complete len:525 (-) comp23862_c0_seq3:4215-5789(-)